MHPQHPQGGYGQHHPQPGAHGQTPPPHAAYAPVPQQAYAPPTFDAPAPRQASVAPPGHAAAPPTPPTIEQARRPTPGGLDLGIDGVPPTSYGALLAQVMLLVAVALALFTGGAVLSGGIEPSTGRLFWYAGAAMFLAPCWVEPLRKGTLGLCWLWAGALTLGLGFGPFLAAQLAVNPDVVAEAGGMTLVVVLGAASYGTFTAHDLARWMRPLGLVLFVTVLSTWFIACTSGAFPVISAAVGVLSAAAIVLDFNHLRRHATEADVVSLAAGIFVSILNIFLSLMSLLRD